MRHQQLADSLAKYIAQLGLERRHKMKSLQEILSPDHTDDNGNGKAD
jgi:hypothetical protein